VPPIASAAVNSSLAPGGDAAPPRSAAHSNLAHRQSGLEAGAIVNADPTRSTAVDCRGEPSRTRAAGPSLARPPHAAPITTVWGPVDTPWAVIRWKPASLYIASNSRNV
jgi:hypothetical protein